MLKKIARQTMKLFGVPEPEPPSQGPRHQLDAGPASAEQAITEQLPVQQAPADRSRPKRSTAAMVSQPAPPAQSVPRESVGSPKSARVAIASPGPDGPFPNHSVHCVDASTLRPPTFGRVPRAAAVPWHLTVEPTTSGIAADQARLGGLQVRAASIVGPSHRCEEPAVARQDSYRLGRDDTGRYLIVAVTDGMSDSRRSDIGAMVAARCAVDVVRYELNRRGEPDDAVLRTAFQSAANAMVTAARESRLSEDEVRSAMIVAILPARPDSRGGERTAWFGSIADASAWLRTEQTWCLLAGEQKDTGMDRNQVRHFLPHYPGQVRIVHRVLPPRATVTVVTDGVGDAFTDVPGANHWFAERWRSPMPLESFLLDVGYHASGQLDDRTAVTVWCEPDDQR